MQEGRFTVLVLAGDSEQAVGLPGSWATQEAAERVATEAVRTQARAAVVKNQSAEIVFTVCPDVNPYGSFTAAEFSSLGMKLRDLAPCNDFRAVKSPAGFT